MTQLQIEGTYWSDQLKEQKFTHDLLLGMYYVCVVILFFSDELKHILML